MGLVESESFLVQSTVFAILAYSSFLGLHWVLYRTFFSQRDAKKSGSAAPVTNIYSRFNKFILLLALLMATGPFIGYNWSFDAGMGYVKYIFRFFGSDPDKVYIIVDMTEAASEDFTKVNTHIYFNAFALVIGAYQFFAGPRIKRPYLHRVLGSLYVTGMTIGCAIAVNHMPERGYGVKEDGAFGATFTFIAMSAATLLPAYMGVYQIVVRRDYLSHREWMSRSIAAALGGAFLFRILLIRVDLVQPRDRQYMAYNLLGWTGWCVALAIMEIYIQYNRNQRLAALWKGLGYKDVHQMNMLLSCRQDEQIKLLQRTSTSKEDNRGDISSEKGVKTR
eukprot:TRINITY_DN6163_c0_g1_i1.p1 TRINITY_DN6163_c0_g1~~TRINITY_DN6163_c0_g1_i1.p1  ORF type:complete len:335 (-),score=18.64 TRINITY_DN6163_c0_g1_i1:49-1053(-)